MTERGKRDVARDAKSLCIGPSSLRWHGDVLDITVDEIGAPIPSRIRGSIRVTPTGFTERWFVLDLSVHHVWQPIAPKVQIEVSLDHPKLQWRGTGYLDSNFGSEPLEGAFDEWTWSRAHLTTDSVVLYDAARRDGTRAALALRFAPDGATSAIDIPPKRELPMTGWRIPRDTHVDDGQQVDVQTLEDTPFYARSKIATTLYGEPALGIHESLSLDRFRSNIVRAMLPFRMPRRFL